MYGNCIAFILYAGAIDSEVGSDLTLISVVPIVIVGIPAGRVKVLFGLAKAEKLNNLERVIRF